MQKNFKNELIQAAKVVALGLVLGLTIGFVHADWSAPVNNAAPPTCASGNPGCDAPIDTSSHPQIKGDGPNNKYVYFTRSANESLGVAGNVNFGLGNFVMGGPTVNNSNELAQFNVPVTVHNVGYGSPLTIDLSSNQNPNGPSGNASRDALDIIGGGDNHVNILTNKPLINFFSTDPTGTDGTGDTSIGAHNANLSGNIYLTTLGAQNPSTATNPRPLCLGANGEVVLCNVVTYTETYTLNGSTQQAAGNAPVSTSTSITIPAGATNITVSGVGGGGGGGGGGGTRVLGATAGAGGGGGQGGQTISNVNLASVAGSTLTITVGAGGSRGNGGSKGTYTGSGNCTQGDGCGGSWGTDSTVYAGSSELFDAGAGSGGGYGLSGHNWENTSDPNSPTGHSQIGGTPGNSGQGPSGGVGGPGNDNGFSASGGNGGAPGISLMTPYGDGGAGGAGGNSSTNGNEGNPGQSGNAGEVIISYQL